MNQATNPTTVSMKMNELEDVANNTYMDKFRGEMQAWWTDEYTWINSRKSLFKVLVLLVNVIAEKT